MEFLIKLNEKQVDRISETLANLGLLLLASMVFPFFVNPSGLSFQIIFSGLSTSLLCLFSSILMLGGVYDE